MNTKLKLIVVGLSLALAISVAGCAVPTSRPPTRAFSALEALREVQQILGLNLNTAGLMAVAGVEGYEQGPGNTLVATSSWVYTFFDSTTLKVRHVKWLGSGITSDVTFPSFADFGALSAPIGTIAMDSTDVAQNVSALSSTPPTLGTVNHYWLNALAGYPLWTAVQSTPNVAQSAFAFNANTGSAVAVSSLPHLTGISMKAVRAAAETAVLVAAQDAILITVAAIENEVANAAADLFSETYYKGYIPVGDLIPGDGLASYWGFLFYSPAQEQIWPVFVYANAVTIIGEPIHDPSSRLLYNKPIPDDIVDPLDLVHHFSGPMTWSTYQYDRPSMAWGISYNLPWGRASGIFDALSGEIEQCHPCS